jgi:hypothetical protein
MDIIALKELEYILQPLLTCKCVTVRHIYAATAVSANGQFQGAVTKGCAQGRQTACVYRELLFLPSFLFLFP